VNYFRAGIWKPRTRPGEYEGIDKEAITWLQEVKEKYGLKICTEVAKAEHVEAVLNAGFDMVWIGARSTANHFTVQEIADALEGVDIPVMVKNPKNPDLKLWLGAIERIEKVGIKQISATPKRDLCIRKNDISQQSELANSYRFKTRNPLNSFDLRSFSHWR